MNDRLIVLAAAQIWQLPFLVLYILGVILALNNRGIGGAASYAALGFGALALSQCVSSVQSVLIADMRSDGSYDVARMAAIFAKRPAPDPSRL